MKTILNQKVAYEADATHPVTGYPLFDGNGKQLTKIIESSYAELILDCIKRPANVQMGYSYDEIENIDNVKTAIKNEKNNNIDFEDAVFKFIVGRVDTMTWGIPSMEFVKFKKYIKSISE